MATAKNLLAGKASDIWTISPGASVLEAIAEMNRRHIGALLVVQENQVIGIFTERDILTRVIGCGKAPDDIKVCDVMTTPVAYCTPDTPVEVCKSIFAEKRIRHLPVMDSDRAVGVIATGDLLAYEASSLQDTVRYLESYISQC